MPFNAKPIGNTIPTTTPHTQQMYTQTTGSLQNAGHVSAVENQITANIEEQVAQLSLQLNQILVKPYLQQALDYLKSSKTDAMNSYNQLSNQIATEVKIITQNANACSLRLEDVNEKINRIQEIIRNKFNNATEEEISSKQLNLEYEYNLVAENYEASLQLTQEISDYKSRVNSLTKLQELLDDSTIPFVNRIQVEIDNLELLVHNFDSTAYPSIVSRDYDSRRKEDFNQIEPRSKELKELSNELNEVAPYSQTPNLKGMKRKEDVAAEGFDDEEGYVEEQKPSFFDRLFRKNRNNEEHYDDEQEIEPEQEIIHVKKPKKVIKYVEEEPEEEIVYVKNPKKVIKYVDEEPEEEVVQVKKTQKEVEAVEGEQEMAPQQRANPWSFFSKTPKSEYDEEEEIEREERLAHAREEAKLMRKMREQEMKFEHMMRMNEMIFNYNKKVDEMIAKQREFERKDDVVETNEEVAVEVKAEPIQEETKAVKPTTFHVNKTNINKGASKSIRVGK
ncbi:MAG: hypothetical protein ACRC4L_00240 [Mycoplasma sp.]